MFFFAFSRQPPAQRTWKIWLTWMSRGTLPCARRCGCRGRAWPAPGHSRTCEVGTQEELGQSPFTRVPRTPGWFGSKRTSRPIQCHPCCGNNSFLISHPALPSGHSLLSCPLLPLSKSLSCSLGASFSIERLR